MHATVAKIDFKRTDFFMLRDLPLALNAGNLQTEPAENTVQ